MTDSGWFHVGLILVILLFARGLRISSLGVYWDDWGIMINVTQHGAFEVLRMQVSDRILMGASHALLAAVFGPNPLAWHVANLVLEFGIALCIYGLLRRLLPAASLIPVLASCLFVAYPLSVIRMQMINVFMNSAIFLTMISLYLTSYPLGARSVALGTARRTAATAAAAALIPVYLLTYEGPLGFEVVRLYILWVVASRSLPLASWLQRVVQIAKAYLPYAAGLLVFVVCRVVLWPMLTQALGVPMRQNFTATSFSLPSLGVDAWQPGPFKVIHVFFQTLIAPWLNAAAILAQARPYDWEWTFAWFLALSAFALVMACGLSRKQPRAELIGAESETGNTLGWLRLLGFSLLAMLAVLAPILAHQDYTVEYHSYQSRHGYGATTVAGLVCLSIAGLLASGLSMTARTSAVTAMAGLLVGLGVSYNWNLTNQWIKEWRSTQTTWRQILLRIPSFKENSLVIFSRPSELKALNRPLRHQDVSEVAQVLYGLDNKTIAGSSVAQYTDRYPQDPDPVLPWLETGDWQTKKTAWPIDPVDVVIDRQHVLVLDEREGCVKVLDKRRQVQEVSSSLSNALSRFSNVDVIQPAPAKQGALELLREKLLGPTDQSWCEPLCPGRLVTTAPVVGRTGRIVSTSESPPVQAGQYRGMASVHRGARPYGRV